MTPAPDDVEARLRAEIDRLRSIVEHDPRTIMLAYEDGDHERLARAASNAIERAETAEALAADRADKLERAVEEAALVCEAQAKLFLSPEYAFNQPLGSLMERFACEECAKAIRALTRTEHRHE